jgi:dihydropyrimidine dehydrogenase (NADP+)
MRGKSSFKGWINQSPPKNELKRHVEKGLPKFGKYLEQRRLLEVEEIKKNGFMIDEFVNDVKSKEEKEDKKKQVTVNDVLGAALGKIGMWGELNNKQHVIAAVNDDMCINCGNYFHYNRKMLHGL